MGRISASAVLALALAGVVVGMAGCTSEPDPSPTHQSTTEPTPTTQAPPAPAPTEPAPATPPTDPAPAPVESPTLAPGALCDPTDGSPDCTDASGDGEYRYVVGYADCVALMDTSPGLCADLDGDGHQGYPDE